MNLQPVKLATLGKRIGVPKNGIEAFEHVLENGTKRVIQSFKNGKIYKEVTIRAKSDASKSIDVKHFETNVVDSINICKDANKLDVHFHSHQNVRDTIANKSMELYGIVDRWVRKIYLDSNNYLVKFIQTRRLPFHGEITKFMHWSNNENIPTRKFYKVRNLLMPNNKTVVSGFFGQGVNESIAPRYNTYYKLCGRHSDRVYNPCYEFILNSNDGLTVLRKFFQSDKSLSGEILEPIETLGDSVPCSILNYFDKLAKQIIANK